MTDKINKPEYCSQAAVRYAEVLYSLELEDQILEETGRIWSGTPELVDVLNNPVVPAEEKHALIDRIFAREIRSFLKVLTDHEKAGLLEEILWAYGERKRKDARILRASLRYVVPPAEDQKKKMEAFLCSKFHAAGVEWELQKDPALIGGFILSAGGEEYDYSVQGRLERLEQRLTWR